MKSQQLPPVLIVAAHPDDEILGCGGTVAKLAQTRPVYSLILGEGITSRDQTRQVSKHRSDLKKLHQQLRDANLALGVTKTFTADLPDNRFDSVTLLDIVKKIENLIDQLQPQTIYTHFGHDLNIDHQITFQAVVTATRPLPGQPVREVYAFETMSSTEFNFPLSFSPDTFSDIGDFLDQKIESLSHYTGEMKPWPHPRSLKFVKQVAQYWGVRVGLPAAEAFQTIRRVW